MKTNLAELTKILDETFAPWNRSDVPGLVVGVAVGGDVIYRRGFGLASIETATANTPKTRMRIGSTSKHFTCLLALLLADQGKLDIDAAIGAYLPELSPIAAAPTLRQLMSHTGGSRCYLDLGLITMGMGTPKAGWALAAQARQTAANFTPGEQMIYCNGGYHLLSLAIERVGGRPFEAQLQERILDPLGMTDTRSIRSDHLLTPGMATLHLVRPDGSFRRGLFPSNEIRGEGAMVSTVDDMLRWLAHLRAPTKVGSPRIWSEMMTPATYSSGQAGVYALGLTLEPYRGVQTIHHAGGVMGGNCQMLTVPEHALDIIIITNRADANPVRLAESVIDAVLADELAPAPETPAVAGREALLGNYYSPQTRMLYSLQSDGQKKLALGICRNPQGMPLTLDAAGNLRATAGGMGLVEVKIAEHDPGADSLMIAACGHPAIYHRLPADGLKADLPGFIGSYRCEDGDAQASVSGQSGELLLDIRGRYGAVEAKVTLFSEHVGVAAAFVPPLFAALTLDRSREDVAGFWLSTMRTRNLRFDRC